MRRLAILYDIGAATPVDIVTSLDGIAEPVFVLPDTEHNARVRSLVTELAEVREPDDVARAKPAGVVTFSDFTLEMAAGVAEQCGLPFHSVDAVRALTRKYRQRTILNDNDVGNTPCHLVTDLDSARRAAKEAAFPAVLKPNKGVGGTNTFAVSGPDELHELAVALVGAGLPTDDGYVLESRLVPTDVPQPWGSFVSVESMVCGEAVSHLGITGKFSLIPPFRERGGYLPARRGSVDERAVLDLTTRALRALKVADSICHTEIMLTPTGPRIIEVNGRMGGHIHDLFRRAHGVDLIALAARLALGEPGPVELAPFNGVVYHYFGLAPMEARELVEAPHVPDVRALPEVERLDFLMPPKSALDWRRGFRDRIYVCRGRVANHDHLADFVENVDRRLGIRFA